MNSVDEAMLLKVNKERQIEALKSIGFDCDENTPLSEVAELMKWAGGLRDVCLATIDKKTGKRVYFQQDEWDAMSSNARSPYIAIGVLLRAECKSYVIAKDYATYEGKGTMLWAKGGYDVPGLTNYNGVTGLLTDFNGAENTAAILDYADKSALVFPAAYAVDNYKACTESEDGFEDNSKWFLPSAAEIVLLARYLTQVNDALNKYFGTKLDNEANHWTSSEYDASYAWYYNFSGGYLYYNNYKYRNNYRVRPFSAE